MVVSAVIFDLEGTLIDISDYHILAFKEVMRKNYSLDFTREDFLAGYGMHPWHIAEMFLKKHGVNASEAECRRLAEEKQVILRAKYADKVRVLPGARELLERFKAAKIRIALASSTPGKNVEFMLKNTGLKGFFKVVVVAEDVAEAKPDPGIFLLAAKKLGVLPSDCVVFEDSVHGVKAAKAAGMKVIAVLSGGTKRGALEAEGAGLVVEDLTSVSAGSLDFA